MRGSSGVCQWTSVGGRVWYVRVECSVCVREGVGAW